MYQIEKKSYGVKLTFAGLIAKDEMQKWVAESAKITKSLPSKFGVFVDMRDLKPLAADSQLVMQEGQKLFKNAGMERSVVILSTAMVTMQFKRIAKETGIYEWERYIDSSKTADWEEIGIKWLEDKIDPDK
ncbi:MAG: hypothetical protein WCA84_16610 [Ignavibacteriaceae bacterium]